MEGCAKAWDGRIEQARPLLPVWEKAFEQLRQSEAGVLCGYVMLKGDRRCSRHWYATSCLLESAIIS